MSGMVGFDIPKWLGCIILSAIGMFLISIAIMVGWGLTKVVQVLVI